ncbi:hypothetical protein ACSSS7_006776 [Eimeria intestinalis]
MLMHVLLRPHDNLCAFRLNGSSAAVVGLSPPSLSVLSCGASLSYVFVVVCFFMLLAFVFDRIQFLQQSTEFLLFRTFSSLRLPSGSKATMMPPYKAVAT